MKSQRAYVGAEKRKRRRAANVGRAGQSISALEALDKRSWIRKLSTISLFILFIDSCTKRSRAENWCQGIMNYGLKVYLIYVREYYK